MKMTNTYRTDIIKALDKLERNGTAPNNYDKSNTGVLMARVYLWKTVMQLASDHYAEAMLQLQGATENETDIRNRDPGEHIIAQSPKFAFVAKLANPSKLFDKNELVSALNKSKYKIPAPIAREFIENATKEGNKKLTLSLMEKSDD